MSDRRKHIVLAAGGTAGHVFPASSLAAEMKARNWNVSIVTDSRGDALGGVQGVETFHIRAGGVAGKKILRLLRSLPELAIGTLQAYLLIRRLRPDVVVGFGGYASVPTMLAATYGKYRTAIHEQNAILGRANRLMASRVDAIASSYAMCKAIPANADQKVIHTGMPVRQEIVDMSDRPYPVLDEASAIGLFVMGGSQGARVLGQVVPAAIERLDDEMKQRLRVVQQCREEDLDSVRLQYDSMGVAVELSTFFNDAPERLANAHLLIGRSGASSVSEALAMGRPAVLVPYPHAIDDHQSANAYAVAGAGAGWVLNQSVFTPDVLAARLTELFANPRVLVTAAACAAAVGRVDAAVRLADMIGQLVDNNDDVKPEQDRGAAT